MKLRALDLFCGAGGASMGMSRAGFEVMGVDIAKQPFYPFRIIYCDAMEADLSGFDFVWASPPCQKHSSLRHITGNDYECFIERTREKLKRFGGPYIIENVMGAPLLKPTMLCGSSFNLGVRRHRIFESNLELVGKPCEHDSQPLPIDVSGTGSFQHSERKKKTGGLGRKPKDLSEARRVMGMEWSDRKGISQAIPPAYSEYLCRQVIAMMQRKAA